MLAACGAPRHTMTADQEFADKAKLIVELERSPTSGPTFDFCPRPAPFAVNWNNASWLAFLSANAYTHMFYLSPVLAELGFTSANDPAWPGCAKDLRVIRGFEDSHHGAVVAASHAKALKRFLTQHAAKWGDCARAWFDKHYDGETFPAPAFEKWLIQTPHPGQHLEFFSGGKITDQGRVFTDGSTQVTFMRHETLPLAIIAFRGTEPNRWNDVATDLKAWKTPLASGWGEVHAGFKQAFDSIAPVMRAKLEEYRRDKVAIWVTGHSLGGGLATLMGAELLRREDAGEDYDLRGVYTFGSPRVGNHAFRTQLMASAAKHAVQLVRFRNGNDIVTSVPKGGEFEHVGELAHLTGDNGVFKVSLEDLPYGGIGSLADHDIAGWAPRPKKAVSGYYRRVLAISKLHPQACDTPVAPVVVNPPVALGTKLACAKVFDPAVFTTALGEQALLVIRDQPHAEATASCSFVRGGTKPTAAEQQRLLKQTGKLGVLPGDVICEVSASCATIEEPERFDKACEQRGGKLFPDHACVSTFAAGAYDLEVHRVLDEDTGCVLSVHGGPANTDNDVVRACVKTARAAFGPAQLK